MRHAIVTVLEDTTGVIRIRYRNTILAYRIMENHPKSEIVDSKHVNIAVDRVKERVWHTPTPTHPWKQPQLYW
jgi:hypothetical protein